MNKVKFKFFPLLSLLGVSASAQPAFDGNEKESVISNHNLIVGADKRMLCSFSKNDVVCFQASENKFEEIKIPADIEKALLDGSIEPNSLEIAVWCEQVGD